MGPPSLCEIRRVCEDMEDAMWDHPALRQAQGTPPIRRWPDRRGVLGEFLVFSSGLVFGILRRLRWGGRALKQPGYFLWLGRALQGVEFRLHGGVAVGELFDGDVLGLVVGEAQVVLGAEECLFHLLHLLDGLIDILNRVIKLA